MNKPLLDCLSGKETEKTPFWLMRQAGRYLPEYQAVRQKAGGFLEMCLNPELAATVTLQPIERFDMDGAILFSDILVIPFALGQNLRFDEGIGPILDPIRDAKAMAALNDRKFSEKIAPILATLRLIKEKLNPTKTLIGFAGAPWTVASYMIEGKTSRDFSESKKFAFEQPELFQDLITLITEVTFLYLSEQIKAGAECVQIFDSWAGMLDEESFRNFAINPTQKLIHKLKAAHPNCPIICFPRQAGLMLREFCAACRCDAISLDSSVPIKTALEVQKTHIVQGNLDPIWLVAGGAAMEKNILKLLDSLGHSRYIFNLGHGIVPQTPPAHVAHLAKIIKNHQTKQKS